MTLTASADAVVVDVEGTTSTAGYVVDTLYPYSRKRFRPLLVERADDPEVVRAVAQVRELAGIPDAGPDDVVAALENWLDRDEKVTPLKTLQGLIWSAGFAAGDLTSHFFPDAIEALRRWRAAGLTLFVYSSGSVAAQRAYFGHSSEGDLLPLIEGLFDTENAGPKRQASSYERITAAIGTPPGRTLFLSDLPAELDAARAAGWQTALVQRPGEPDAAADPGTHPVVGTFAEVEAAP